MEILFVGNKPLNFNIDYNQYDIICQVNRMGNILKIPRVDLWYCDCHKEFFQLNNNIKESEVDFKKVTVLLPYSRLNNKFILKDKFNLKNIKILDIETNEKSTFEINGIQKKNNVLTSDIIFLKWVIKNYPNYNITVIGLDVYNRGYIMSNLPSHKGTWHENAVYDEEEWLKKLIKNNKIKFINDVPNNNTSEEKISKIG